MRGTSAPLARATSAISTALNPISAMASAHAKTCRFSAPAPGKGCTFRALFGSSGRAHPYFEFMKSRSRSYLFCHPGGAGL
jgi:hypothetical protein